MSEIFLHRKFDPPISIADVHEMARLGSGCYDLYGISWRMSLLSADGRALICHYGCADAESVRIALRKVGAEIFRLWPGTIHQAPGTSAADQSTANVAVLRHFEDPVSLEEIQAIEDAGAWCLETRRVKFLRTYFSVDRKNMVCLYRAPDAESVRAAQDQARMPLEQVWAFTPIGPET